MKFTCKGMLLACLILLQTLLSSAQSETHDFITYDTVIHIQPDPSNIYYYTNWNVRISRPANLFTANHPDTAGRPALITMGGFSEQGVDDTSNLTAYGPHYWLNNGWDGSITLANGIHYPILITVNCTTAQYPNATNMVPLISYLIAHYHIKTNSVHLAGITQGAASMTSIITFEETAGAETGMKLITSIAALQAFGDEQDGVYNNWNRRDTAYGIWAKKYHGRYFGLQGSGDIDRNVHAGTKAVNDSVPGAGYFAYENAGGGTQCCWNSLYDPGVTNWQATSPYGTYITTGPDYTNTNGTYKTGSNLFQWMLRQGDTALVNAETHNFITYDTTIHIQPDPSNIYYYTNWNVRISRPANLFTANHPDTASRPAFITMGGFPEQGVDDTANLTTYGPHYWLNNGWDGSVTLDNGIHYPILITVNCTTAQYPNATNMVPLINYLITHYHIKPNSVHLAGITQGAASMTSIITFEDSAGAETGMKLITSIAALQAFGDEQDGVYNNWNRRDTAYGIWAKKYHGRYFGLQGSNDVDRNVHAGAKAVNDSVPGSGYFAYDSIGGGLQCCWNTMYNPSIHNWQATSPYGTYITTGPDYSNTNGTYKAGSNLFQWMLRQGDTTLVTGSTTPVDTTTTPPPVDTTTTPFPGHVKKVIVAEYRTWYIRDDSTIYGYNNGSAYPVQWVIGGRKAVAGAGGFNVFRVIDDQGYIWTSNNDIGATSNRIDTDSTGNAFDSNVYVDAYANTAVSIRADGSVWYWGLDSYNLFYTGGLLGGSATGTPMLPAQLSPAGMQFKKVLLGGNRIMALTTNGDVYEWLPNGSRTPTQLTIPRAATDIFVSHLDIAGCIVPDAGETSGLGYPYIMGTTTSMYGGQSNPAYTQPTSLKSLWNMTVPIREISVNWNTIHYIDSLGRLFGCGFNSMGEVGNGQEFVNKFTYPGFPGYGWDFVDYENPSGIPTQLDSSTNWRHLYSNNWFAFYKYAQDASDSIYSWGRNKSLDLGNGYSNLQDASSYDAMDVLQPTMVHPLTARYQTYNFTAPTLNAGSDQTISTTSTTLSASGNPCLVIHNGTLYNGVDSVGYHWVAYQWTKLSGPACTITTPTALTTTVTGMSDSTYTFQLIATDNNTGTIADTVKVTVNSGAAKSPSALAGNAATLDSTSATEFCTLTPTVGRDNSTVRLTISSNTMGSVKIRILDVNGRPIQTLQTAKSSTLLYQDLPVSSLPVGTYWVQVLIGSGRQFTTRFIRL